MDTAVKNGDQILYIFIHYLMEFPLSICCNSTRQALLVKLYTNIYIYIYNFTKCFAYSTLTCVLHTVTK